MEGFESVESAFEGHLDTNETKVNIASIISIAAIIIIASLVFYAYKKRPQGRGNRPDDNRTLGGIEMQGAWEEKISRKSKKLRIWNMSCYMYLNNNIFEIPAFSNPLNSHAHLDQRLN